MPGTPAWPAARLAAAGAKLAPSTRTKAGALDALMAEYQGSLGWAELAPRTAASYRQSMRHIARALGDREVASIRAGDVAQLVNTLAVGAGTPGAACRVVTVMSLLMAFAIFPMGLRDDNPARGIKRPRPVPHKSWPEPIIAHALTPGVLPEDLRRVVVLALHTGQRRGDLIAMRWTDYRDGAIHLTQGKTGVALRVPVTAELAAELASWRRDPVGPATILCRLSRFRGTAWTSATIDAAWRWASDRKGSPLAPYVIHGLRKAACTRLANAGATVHEIAAVSGHKTLQMVQHYTRDADQAANALAAVARLDARAVSRAVSSAAETGTLSH